MFIEYLLIISTFNPPKNSLKESTIIIFIVQEGQLRYRKIRYFVQGYNSNCKLSEAMECFPIL